MNIDLKNYLNVISNIDELKIENEESLTSRALQFAIIAHENQYRKDNTLYINHPIAVANMVRNLGYNDEVIAAAYLHDVVEDTKYTIDDIEKNFGSYVAHLVLCASESDKKLSWEDRKKETIAKIKKLNEEENIILLCDKINNIENMIDGVKQFKDEFYSKFKRGKDEQKWYYENLLTSFKEVYPSNYELILLLQRHINELFYE